MPLVLWIGPYRVYFFNHDTSEPPHVHVDRNDSTAKFWIQPVALAYNTGFKPHELRRIEKVVSEQARVFLEAWRDHFGPDGG